MAGDTEVVRILPDDKKLVEAEAIGKEPFPYVLHRVISAGLRSIEDARKAGKRDP